MAIKYKTADGDYLAVTDNARGFEITWVCTHKDGSDYGMELADYLALPSQDKETPILLAVVKENPGLFRRERN